MMNIAMNMAGLALRGVIRAYQLLISPVLPAHCRYAPSCSAYALEAVRRFGDEELAALLAEAGLTGSRCPYNFKPSRSRHTWIARPSS